MPGAILAQALVSLTMNIYDSKTHPPPSVLFRTNVLVQSCCSGFGPGLMDRGINTASSCSLVHSCCSAHVHCALSVYKVFS